MLLSQNTPSRKKNANQKRQNFLKKPHWSAVKTSQWKDFWKKKVEKKFQLHYAASLSQILSSLKLSLGSEGKKALKRAFKRKILQIGRARHRMVRFNVRSKVWSWSNWVYAKITPSFVFANLYMLRNKKESHKIFISLQSYCILLRFFCSTVSKENCAKMKLPLQYVQYYRTH